MPGVVIETNQYWDAGKVSESAQKRMDQISEKLLKAALSLNGSTFFKDYIKLINSSSVLAHSISKRLGRLASYYFSTAEAYEVNEQIMILTVFSDLNVDYKIAKIDGRDVIISGNPEEKKHNLDYNQANGFSIDWGDCGIVSTLNLLRLIGYDIDESDITKVAKENGFADYDTWNPFMRGGSTWEDRIALLKYYNIEAQAKYVNKYDTADSFESTVDYIAAFLESGRGVILSLNADALNGNSPNGEFKSNHVVLVTGTVRDTKTGEIIGLYVCDSSRGKEEDACRYVSADQLRKCMYDAEGTSIVVTTEPVLGKSK